MQQLYIVIYRPHNMLNLDTKYYGPFTYDEAEERICKLKNLGQYQEDNLHNNPGCKFIEELHN